MRVLSCGLVSPTSSFPLVFASSGGRCRRMRSLRHCWPRARRNRIPRCLIWLDFLDWRRRGAIGRKGLGLIELCEQCERVELWIDPVPNAQLILVQLLDYFHAHAKLAPKLRLVQANVVSGNMLPDELSKWTPAAVEVSGDHLEIASRVWQAYRQPTPRPKSRLDLFRSKAFGALKTHACDTRRARFGSVNRRWSG